MLLIRLNIWRKTPLCFVFYYILWIWSETNYFFPERIQIRKIFIILVYYEYKYEYYSLFFTANTNINLICKGSSQIYSNIWIIATLRTAPIKKDSPQYSVCSELFLTSLHRHACGACDILHVCNQWFYPIKFYFLKQFVKVIYLAICH